MATVVGIKTRLQEVGDVGLIGAETVVHLYKSGRDGVARAHLLRAAVLDGSMGKRANTGRFIAQKSCRPHRRQTQGHDPAVQVDKEAQILRWRPLWARAEVECRRWVFIMSSLGIW